MKNEPCIRLGMRIKPKISEKPAESRNSNPPSAKLLAARMAACASVICVIMASAPQASRKHGFRTAACVAAGMTPESGLLFQVPGRRLVAPINRRRQELLLVVIPELTDARIGLDHRVDQLPALALALADEDIADHVAILVELDRSA